MKVLVKDKIVESFRFPFSEALSFSILLWTFWGLAESLYWHRIHRLFDDQRPTIDSSVYIEAFLLYLVLAAVLASFVYWVVKLSVVALEQYESYRFRGVTLALIVLTFFFLILNYYVPVMLAESALPKLWQYAIAAATIAVALLTTVVVFRWASGIGFRIRRSGTLMLSVLSASIVLSVVHFPIFAPRSRPIFSFHPAMASVKRLTIYYYLKPLIEPERGTVADQGKRQS